MLLLSALVIHFSIVLTESIDLMGQRPISFVPSLRYLFVRTRALSLFN
jgi:hypothetical protein